MAQNAGDKLGPEIVAPLGAGGMGEVYRATRRDRTARVALKGPAPAFARDPRRIARFEREAKLLASLNHPAHRRCTGSAESEGRRVLVLELVAGESLAERLRRGPDAARQSAAVAARSRGALGKPAHEWRGASRPETRQTSCCGPTARSRCSTSRARQGQGRRSQVIVRSPVVGIAHDDVRRDAGGRDPARPPA